MKKFPKKLAVFFVIAVAIVVAWQIKYPSGSWRYKLTISVETPEGVKTGSAVRQVDAYRTPGFLGVSESGHARAYGEAVVVDLDKRGILFVIMDVDGSYTIPFYAFPLPGEKPGNGGLTAEGIKYYSNLEPGLKAKVDYRRPQLVTFEDLNDPKTIKILKYEDLASVFGEGVTFKEITVEMTDEPITVQIKQYLPSFQNEDFMEWYKNLEYGDLRKIGPDRFSRGKI